MNEDNDDITKVQLTPDQVIDLVLFLEAESKEAPKNFSEWGEDWIRICNLKNDIRLMLKGDVLPLRVDDWHALHNYLADYVHTLKSEKMGVVMFTKYRDLFTAIHGCDLGAIYPISFFVPTDYDAIPRVLYVNPNAKIELR
ncbi:MAG: hypothetical protein JWO03_922 [Bacteroidetes bacterium]|nr:hypothetical protein [Bacteroidota bacterium]